MPESASVPRVRFDRSRQAGMSQPQQDVRSVRQGWPPQNEMSPAVLIGASDRRTKTRPVRVGLASLGGSWRVVGPSGAGGAAGGGGISNAWNKPLVSAVLQVSNGDSQSGVHATTFAQTREGAGVVGQKKGGGWGGQGGRRGREAQER
jgi:hypothetical protein